MLAFAHIPKTAGTSLRKALDRAYGHRVVFDYFDLDWRRPGVRASWLHVKTDAVARCLYRPAVVFGHYPLWKYRGLARQFGAVFRDPLDRTISEYFYLKSRQPPDKFARRPDMMNVYRYYLGNVPIERLDFVGITEEYELSVRLFHAIFGVELEPHRERVGTGADYRAMLRGQGAIDQVIETQRDNQKIYDAARSRFDVLCRMHL